jgi:hypothetical protein
MLKDPTTETDMDRNLVLEAIRTIKEKGWDLNPFTVADEANLPRAAIYQNVEYMAMIIQARGGTFGMDIDTSLDLARRIQHLEQINGILSEEVRNLKEELKKHKQANLEPLPSENEATAASDHGPIGLIEGQTQTAEVMQTPPPAADGPGMTVSKTAGPGEAIYNAAGVSMSHTQIPNPFAVLTWRELETVYRFPVAGRLEHKEGHNPVESYSTVVAPTENAPDLAEPDVAEIKRGVETADQEPVRSNEVTTSEQSVVYSKRDVETADHEPVEDQTQTGDRLIPYSPDANLSEQFNRPLSLSDSGNESEKVHRLEQPPMLEISHRQDGLDDEHAVEFEEEQHLAHPTKSRKKRKRAADSTGDFDQPFEGSTKNEPRRLADADQPGISIPIPIISPARPVSVPPPRSDSMTFNELAAIDAEAMALLSGSVEEESTLFHQHQNDTRPVGPTVNAAPIDVGAIRHYQETGLTITDTACGNAVQNGQAFESMLGYDHSTKFQASQEALDPTFTGFGGSAGLNYDSDWQLNTQLREPARSQYTFHQVDRNIEAPETQIDQYTREYPRGEGFPDNVLYAQPESLTDFTSAPIGESFEGIAGNGSLEQHEKEVDLEAMDIFEDFNEEDLEGIEIIDDVMPQESEDLGTTDDTVSGDQLRDLIKSRIQQAVDHVAVEPKPEETPAPKEQEAKGLNSSKFVGGKSKEPATGQSFVTRIVPPEIRRACLILGVRPEEMTERIVKEAWKRQIASPGVHPDLGGETESAIYLNTAKDTLVRWLDQQAPKLGKKFGSGGAGGSGKPGPS